MFGQQDLKRLVGLALFRHGTHPRLDVRFAVCAGFNTLNHILVGFGCQPHEQVNPVFSDSEKPGHGLKHVGVDVAHNDGLHENQAQQQDNRR